MTRFVFVAVVLALLCAVSAFANPPAEFTAVKPSPGVYHVNMVGTGQGLGIMNVCAPSSNTAYVSNGPLAGGYPGNPQMGSPEFHSDPGCGQPGCYVATCEEGETENCEWPLLRFYEAPNGDLYVWIHFPNGSSVAALCTRIPGPPVACP